MKTAVLLTAAFSAILAQDRAPLPASGSVSLPLDEYNSLVAQANKQPKPPAAPPQPFTLKSADVKIQVAGELASATIELEGEVFAAGVATVPLVTGMTVLNAQQRGRDLPLELVDSSRAALLPGPAEFQITLEAGLPLHIEPGRASFTLPAPAAGAVRLTLTLPGDHTNVNLNPGLIVNRSSAGGRTTIEAVLAPGVPLNIWWATRDAAPPPAPREVRFLSDIKTLVSVSEAQLRITALADVTVVQGEPVNFTLAIPKDYEVTGVIGASLRSNETGAGALVLHVAPQRSHQFLITLETSAAAAHAIAPILTLQGTQRETGEVLVESEGAMELAAKESGGLKRMDIKEVSPYLRSLSRESAQSAFRYHRQPGEAATLELSWTRFAGASAPAALAQQATATTLVTAEGRSLTEVKLTVTNLSQPFLKVALPPGSSILSGEVAGAKVKPVEGSDGNRVPLLRTGFRPSGPYAVSFVFLHSGSPFARKGASELALPKIDLPIAVLEWEVFLPDRYMVKQFGGDALIDSGASVHFETPAPYPVGLRGLLTGIVKDPIGAVVTNAHIIALDLTTKMTRQTDSDSSGRWTIAGMPSGRLRVTASSPGFNQQVNIVDYDSNRGASLVSTLQIGSTNQTVEVNAAAESINTSMAQTSSNVFTLQQRIAGVLPVKIEVPKTGRSFHFIRPLVLNEETKLTFAYRTK